MGEMNFIWDEDKNRKNLKAHNISFEEAKTVFYDSNAKIIEAQMRDEYDFSNAKPNPYTKKLRKQITIRIDTDTIDYFTKQADKTGIKYQNLINLYLSDCAMHEKTIKIAWK
jgi:uncharacterized protein (DUF4415 family)